MALGRLSAIAGLILMPAITAQAGTMLQPLSASTNMGSFSASYPPSRIVDKSGLAASYTSGVTNFDTFVTATNTVNGANVPNIWFSQNTLITGNFDFDLGGSFNIESFALWSDPQSANQGVNSFTLFADDNAGFSSPANLGSYNAANIINNATNFGQVFSFSPTVATHVRMQVNSNHGSATTTAIVEAAFEVVPEPGSLGMVALAGLATAIRRRRSSSLNFAQ